MSKHQAVFTKDENNKRMTISRDFDAPLDKVWQAWTTSELLDKWWAPKPFRAETKEMDFREGGHWLYAMVSPENDRNWCIEKFKQIEPGKLIGNSVFFCDEHGNINKDFAAMHWKKNFSGSGDKTSVLVEIDFENEEDLRTIVEMGMEEGFTAGLNNLEELLG